MNGSQSFSFMFRLQNAFTGLRRKLYVVDSVALFLINQMVPNRKVNPQLPAHFRAYDKLLQNNLEARGVLSTKFSMATWNIEMGYQKAKLQNDVTTLGADVILLQEVPVFSENEGPFLGDRAWNFVYAPGLFVRKKSARYAFAHRGQLTLSTAQLQESSMLPLKLVSRYNSHRGSNRYSRQVALYTKLQTEKGTLGIYNVHLENHCTPNGRRVQMRELLTEISKKDDQYVLIAGDFNTIFGKVELLDILNAAGFTHAKTQGFTCGPLVLDHVFHSANMNINADIVLKKSSDHRPIVAQVELL
jgi:endonuclease/exonuclease/phosphatase family metal-dependent hydrolase